MYNIQNRILTRDSNIELARVVAMLLIMLLHSVDGAFWSSHSDNKFPLFVLVLNRSISDCAVGLFVLITGWYGISAKYKSIINLVFQILFYTILITICMSFVNRHIGTKEIAAVLLVSEHYWFIKSYILLLIVSPVLNSFIETSSQKTLRNVIIVYFLFQTIYGWTDAAPEFSYGYSTLFMIWLYMLARYVKLYRKDIFSKKAVVYLLAFIASALMLTMWLMLKIEKPFGMLTQEMVLAYINPLVVFMSLTLFGFFLNIRFSSKTVNWVAASVFPVYLIHENFLIAPVYRRYAANMMYCHTIYSVYLYVIAVFCICVFIDQLRRLIYNVLIETKMGRIEV